MIKVEQVQFQTIIIGGGPAGTGPLMYGSWSGRLAELLDRGVALVEQSSELCVGKLSKYQVTANTAASDFIDFLMPEAAAAVFPKTRGSDLYQTLLNRKSELLPLPEIGKLLKMAGEDLGETFSAYSQSELFLGWSVSKVQQLANGQYQVQLLNEQGENRTIQAKQVLLATGGTPTTYKQTGRLVHELAQQAGAEASPLLMSSEELLTESGLQTADMWLNNYDDPQVVIIGGSHSAFSSAWLLNRLEDSDFEPDDGQIKIVHRAPIKVWYESAEQARQDGYDDFTEQDICASTKNVFYLAGLKGDAKQLYREIAGLDEQNKCDGVQLLCHAFTEQGLTDSRINWENVALVIFAGGYDFCDIKIENPLGGEISLQGHFTGRYVNEQLMVLDSLGNPIDGLFAVGLGTGFSLTKYGSGESSFKGQEHSVWFCHHDIGESLFKLFVG